MLVLHRYNSGIILSVAILVVLITIILSTAYGSRAVLEKNMADREVKRTQALYASEAGGQTGIGKLDTLINTYLLNTVNGTNPATVSTSAAMVLKSRNIRFMVISPFKYNAIISPVTPYLPITSRCRTVPKSGLRIRQISQGRCTPMAVIISLQPQRHFL